MAYAVTLARGLTWLHDGADGGDLIAAAASGGVAHPPGYPAYLVLARLFLLLPFGSPALRTNLLSAASAVGASLLVADAVRLAHGGRHRIGAAAGVLAGFAFGLSPLLWSQAVITEVYGLHALLVAASLRALPVWPGAPNSLKAFAFWGAITGIALANHLTSIFLVPAGLGLALCGRACPELAEGSGRRMHSLTGASIGLAGGAALYALLPWWASRHPAINWGNASTGSGFWWLVTGEPYRGLVFQAWPYLWSRLQAGAGLWVEQFGAVGLVAGLSGLLITTRQPAVLRWILLWLFLCFSVFAIGYNTSDSYTYLLPAFLAFAIWLGQGLAIWLEAAGSWQRVLTALFIVALFFNAAPAMARVDASRDDAAERFGRAVLEGAPPGAIIITSEDRDSFALWYWREAAGARRDLIVVVERLLPFDWYRDQLRWTYPDIQLAPGSGARPGPGWADELIRLNDRPVCWTFPDQNDVLICDSLLKPASDRLERIAST
jgi:hypothetical protein